MASTNTLPLPGPLITVENNTDLLHAATDLLHAATNTTTPTAAAGNRGEASYSGSTTGAAAAAALLAAAGPQPEPWTRLAGLAEALAVMEAAISQNIFLPQLLQYR